MLFFVIKDPPQKLDPSTEMPACQGKFLIDVSTPPTMYIFIELTNPALAIYKKSIIISSTKNKSTAK
jgi:hypothetical protein